MADRNSRMLRIFKIGVFELILVLFLVVYFDILGIILYALVAFTILPSPIILVPDKYEITQKEIVFDKGQKFPLQKKYKLQMNEDKNFVSFHHQRRGEFLRLYTEEPQKVHEILNRLILEEEVTEVKKEEPTLTTSRPEPEKKKTRVPLTALLRKNWKMLAVFFITFGIGLAITFFI